jgi:Domain of unknown function (DUF4913)
VAPVREPVDEPLAGAVDAVDPIVELVAVVERLRLDVDDDRALIDQLELDLAGLGAGGTGVGAGKPADGQTYDGWQAWVDDWLTTRISRHPHRCRWCDRYAEHPEVADRLEALWHAWEAQWPQPLLRLGWLRDGLDPQLAVIMTEDGPLRGCSALELEHVDDVSLGWLGDQTRA